MGSLFLEELCLVGFCAWHFTRKLMKNGPGYDKISATYFSVRLRFRFSASAAVQVATPGSFYSNCKWTSPISLSVADRKFYQSHPNCIKLRTDRQLYFLQNHRKHVAPLCWYHMLAHAGFNLSTFSRIGWLTHWTVIYFPTTPLHSDSRTQFSLLFLVLSAFVCRCKLLPAAPNNSLFWTLTLEYVVLSKNNEHSDPIHSSLHYICWSLNRWFVSTFRYMRYISTWGVLKDTLYISTSKHPICLTTAASISKPLGVSFQ